MIQNPADPAYPHRTYTAVDLSELMDAAGDVRDLEQQLAAARERLDTRIGALHAGGCPITDIAETAGLSRPSVYKAIERASAMTVNPPDTKSSREILSAEK